MTGEATRNLLVVHTPREQAIEDWIAVQGKINARAPDIEVRIAENGRLNPVTRRWQARRPSLVFSAAPLEAYRPMRGKVYAGYPLGTLGKLRENRRLCEAGLPVLETMRLGPELRLTDARWHPYVVVKPEMGKRGKGIRLVRTEDLQDRYAELTRNGRRAMLVQPYVEHVDGQGRPRAYRVLTLFGHELYAGSATWLEQRRPLADLADDPAGIIAVNDGSISKKSRQLVFDDDVIALARSTNRAFPEVPVLGIDIVRETGTGRLFIMEANPSGQVWRFSSRRGQETLSPESRQRMYAQFDALDRAADLLIEKVRSEAV